MKLCRVLSFRFTEQMLAFGGRRGRGMVEGLRNTAFLKEKKGKGFVLKMARTVGLNYKYKPWGSTTEIPTVIRTPKAPSAPPDRQKAERVRRLILESIDEVYCSGQCGPLDDLPEFTVTEATVTDDLNLLTIRYDAVETNEISNQEMQKQLEEIAPKLRKGLYSLNIGSIPEIKFVADFSRNKLDVLEDKFSTIKIDNPEENYETEREKQKSLEKEFTGIY